MKKQDVLDFPLISKIFLDKTKLKDDRKIPIDAAEAELNYWVVLLSYHRIAGKILDAIEINANKITDSTPPDINEELVQLRQLLQAFNSFHSKLTIAQEKKWATLCKQLATKIRLADQDREWMAEANSIVKSFNGVKTKKYNDFLERVEVAYKNQLNAKEIFARANIGLVLMVAQKHSKNSMPLGDLVQEGYIGLMSAVNRFDYTLGIKFSTYASYWIRDKICRSIANKCRTVRIPTHMLDQHRELLRFKDQFEIKQGREPTFEELKKQTGLKEDQLDFLIQVHSGASISLDSTVGDDNTNTYLDCLADESVGCDDLLHTAELVNKVKSSLSILTPIEKQIISWRFGIDDEEEKTLIEIGNHYDRGRERIRQIQDQALKKLKANLIRTCGNNCM